MQVGFKVCPSGGRAVCESKNFYWGGTRHDQAATPGQGIFSSIFKGGGALTIRGVTISVSAAVSLAALLFTELGREPMMAESVNNRGRHRPWGASFRHYFLCSQSSSRSLDPGLGSTADEAM